MYVSCLFRLIPHIIPLYKFLQQEKKKKNHKIVFFKGINTGMCIIDKNIKGAVFCSKNTQKIPRNGLLKFVIVLVFTMD